MRDLAIESVEIKNNYLAYPFCLRCDDIKGIIKMHKNSTKEHIKITRREIPITHNQRWAFYARRTGWDGKCSYLTRDDNHILYDKWKKIMCETYSKLRDANKEI